MLYTVIINDHSFDLPKKTLAVTEKLENVIRTDTRAGVSLREKYKVTYDCVANLIGPENAAEAIGATIDDCDVNDITLAFRMIVDAYNKPLEDYKTDRSAGNLNRLPLDKLMTLVEAAKQVNKLEEAGHKKESGPLQVVK